MTVPEAVRELVVSRAENRCEYCRLSQLAQEAAFHVDHIIPQSAGGPTDLDNLALSCVTCSLRKAARLTVRDALTGTDVPVFNPRRNVWSNHFRWDGVLIVGVTAIGRATADTLQMNRPQILSIRMEERDRGRLPVD